MIKLALIAVSATLLAAQQQVDWQPDLVYSQPGGAALKLDLASPISPGVKPLVVCIHGGAWMSGSKAGYSEILRMLAAQGYAAAAIDYRLAPQHRYPAQVDDIAAALAYLAGRANELGLDMRRVALVGDSAGGHLAMMAGLKSSPGVRVRAIVNIFGVADLTTWKLSTEGARIEGRTDAEILEAAFGTSERTSPVLREASPLSRIGRGAPAVLTLHGDADPVVSLEQSKQLHQKLEQAGIANRLEVFAGAGHNFVGPDLEKAFALTTSHLNAYLRPSAPSFERIDAHAHVAPPPAAFLQMLDRLKVRLLNVTLVDPLVPGFDKPEPQSTWAAGISRQSGGRIAWAAPFDPTGFQADGWAGKEIRRLSADVERGAVAVKIYKSVGLIQQSAGGQYVLPDDPAFAPVLDGIAAKGATLLAHLAEPRSSWQPLDPADPHYSYYKANPDWHMFQHPERPKWETIIAARDRMLGAHPSLRVIGCHLGSMEHDVDEVAKRLDKYPNFAVDTAARMPNLMRQPRGRVRDFLIRYQDRVLWGTDLMELKWEDPAGVIARWEAAYLRDWQFFAQELDLPEPVLRKIFRENALRWIPGLAENRVANPLPSVDQVISRYVEAMGGKPALRNITTRAAAGSIFVATYGAYGEYREFAKAPRSLRRTFRFPRYASLERAFDGTRAWEEGPDYGLEMLSGARLNEARRQAEFQLALNWDTIYPRLTVQGRGRIDEFHAVILEGVTQAGEKDQLWFDETSGLLLAIDSTETFANGVAQRVRYQFEDYRPVHGVQVAHQIRYESPRLIWVVKRQVAFNVPVDDAVFQPPQ